MTHRLILISAIAPPLLVAGCATAPPRVASPPPPTPAIAPARPEPIHIDWRDLPLSPGNWVYAAEPGGSAARFGQAGTAELVVRCDRAARMIRFVRASAGMGRLTITTSYSARDLPLAPGAGGTIEASLAASDPFLDRIAFSRGRVSYAVPGKALLMVPAWAEPARVIEDCRS